MPGTLWHSSRNCFRSSHHQTTPLQACIDWPAHTVLVRPCSTIQYYTSRVSATIYRRHQQQQQSHVFIDWILWIFLLCCNISFSNCHDYYISLKIWRKAKKKNHPNAFQLLQVFTKRKYYNIKWCFIYTVGCTRIAITVSLCNPDIHILLLYYYMTLL